MKLIPDNFIPPNNGMREVSRVVIVGAGVVLLVAAILVFSGGMFGDGADAVTGTGAQQSEPAKSSAASATPSVKPAVQDPVGPPSSSEKQKLFDAMQKKAQ